jgi:hypothetical protein
MIQRVALISGVSDREGASRTDRCAIADERKLLADYLRAEA